MHKGTSYHGEHEAIIDRALWDKFMLFCEQAHASVPPSPALR